MSGLTQQDLEILGFYAERGNRELYWNYLAQKEGADSYGRLALGVVRNDSMPGATANHFADNRARADGRVLSERDWERFGEDLVQRDLTLRRTWFEDDRPDLALNLPVADVQRAHDDAFENARIDPNAWTPRQLLEAARRQGGDEAAEEVWSTMLDSSRLGLDRATATMRDVAKTYNDADLDAWKYSLEMGMARFAAGADRARIDPDRIGASELYYQYDRRSGEWSSISSGGPYGPVIRQVTEPELIRRLDDARDVRLETEAQRDDFHPDDPNRDRPIARSPFTIADADLSLEVDVRLARSQGAQDGSNHPLYQQALAAMSRRDAELGRETDESWRSIAAAGAVLAARGGYQRIDDIVFNVATDRLAAGERFFVIERSANPEVYRRDSMLTNEALAMTAEQREQQVAQIDALQVRAMEARASQLAQNEQQRTQAGPQLA